MLCWPGVPRPPPPKLALRILKNFQFPPKLHFEDIPDLLDHPDGVNNEHLCSQYIVLVLRIPKRYHM